MKFHDIVTGDETSYGEIKSLAPELFKISAHGWSDDAKGIISIVNQGIDSHLEACMVSARGDNWRWDNERLYVNFSPESLCVFIRRCMESDDENMNQFGSDCLNSLKHPE